MTRTAKLNFMGLWVASLSSCMHTWLRDWQIPQPRVDVSNQDPSQNVFDGQDLNHMCSLLQKNLTAWAVATTQNVLRVFGEDAKLALEIEELLHSNLPGGAQWEKGEAVSASPFILYFFESFRLEDCDHHSLASVLRDVTILFLSMDAVDFNISSEPNRGDAGAEDVTLPDLPSKKLRKPKKDEKTDLLHKSFSDDSDTKKKPLYNARVRVVLFSMVDLLSSASLLISHSHIRAWESVVGKEVAAALAKTVELSNSQKEEAIESTSCNSRPSAGPNVNHVEASQSSRFFRRIKVGAAAVGGGVLLALTGGLAAPAVIAGLGSVGAAIGGLGSLGAAIGNVVVGAGTFLSAAGTAGAVSVFGAFGASLTGWKMNRRWGDLKEFFFVDVNSNSTASSVSEALELRICVSGWLKSRKDVRRFWHTNETQRPDEVYSVQWESEDLIKLGDILRRLITDELAKQAATWWIQMTIGASAAPAMFPVWIIRSMSDLDNSWLVVKDRSTLAGEVLASALADQARVGSRPITLLAFSMGTRVVFKALEVLEKRGLLDIVQDVVLLGPPLSVTFDTPAGVGEDRRRRWRCARAAVSGRMVSCYSRSDWVLGLLYRYLQWGVHVAGLSKVEGICGVESVDVSHIVHSHDDYAKYIPEILAEIGILF